MPKKKGKKKAKKSSAKSDDAGAENPEIEGDGAQLGISKKKKEKKPKLTKEEKAHAKLVKQMTEFVADTEKYNAFQEKMDNWMRVEHKRVERVFKPFDEEGDGVVPLAVFKAGLTDLGCPVTSLEADVFALNLDPEQTGMIEYSGFERGMHRRVFDGDSDDSDDPDQMLPEDYVPILYSRSEARMRITSEDPFQNQVPRFVDLDMRLAMFEHYANHPCHLRFTIHDTVCVRALIVVVGKMSRVTSGELSVYATRECKTEDKLPLESTLADCGLEGGALRRPTKATLFYDYAIEYSDCPLLNCDHYFGQDKRPRNPVLHAYMDDRK